MTTDTSREALIKRLAEQWATLDPADPYRSDVGLAADMLEADKREPLSDDQIYAVWDGIALSKGYPVSKAGKQFARAIEAYHGI